MRHEVTKRAGIAPALALIGAMAAPWAGCSSSSKPVGFAPRYPSAERTAALIQKDSDALGDYRPVGQASRLVELFQQANRITASHPKVLSPELERTLLSVRMAAKRHLLDESREAFRQLGLYLTAEFEDRLAALSRAAQKAPGAATALLTGARPSVSIREAHERFVQIGGGFLVLAASNRLVRSDERGGIAVDERDRLFIRLAFKVYWSNVLPEATDAMDWMLSTEERRWYEIWVAERSVTAPLRRKLAAIRYLETHDSAYRAHLARGIVYYQHRMFEKASRSFSQALREHPDDSETKRFLAQAKRRAGP